MVEEQFLIKVEKILTMDGKAYIVKVIIDALSKVYERLSRKEHVSDPN